MVLRCEVKMNQIHQFIEVLVRCEQQKLLVHCGP